MERIPLTCPLSAPVPAAFKIDECTQNQGKINESLKKRVILGIWESKPRKKYVFFNSLTFIMQIADIDPLKLSVNNKRKIGYKLILKVYNTCPYVCFVELIFHFGVNMLDEIIQSELNTSTFHIF